MAAAAAAKVAQRCEGAKETGNLDLSGCELRQVPTCVYLLMKGTTVNSCDFSQNVIKKIPAKLGQEFTQMTGLILHDNDLSTLPDTLCGCCHLEHLDLSHNNLESVPDVVFTLQSLQTLNLSNNKITNFEVDRLENLRNLKELDLSDNMFNDDVKGRLQVLNHLTVKL